MKKTLSILVLILLIAVGGYYFYQTQRKSTENTAKKAEKEVIKIGAILPLTGPAGSLGVYYKNGLKIKIDEINSNGGINGKKVKLLIKDSKTSAKEGVFAINNLLSLDKPLFVFSHLSSITLAINPILKKKNIPVIAVSASAKLLNYNLAIRNYITPERLAKFSFENFHNKLKLNNFSLIYVGDDFGTSVAKYFKEECDKSNVKITYEDKFNLRNTDYKNLVLKIIASKPEAVYITGYGKPLALLIKQLKDLKYKGTICTGIEVTQPEILDFLGDYSNGIYFPNLLFDNLNNNENNKKFNLEYEKRFNKKSFSASALAYDGVGIMLDLYRDAGYNKNEFLSKLNTSKTIENALNGDIKLVNREIVYTFTLNTIKNNKIIAVNGN